MMPESPMPNAQPILAPMADDDDTDCLPFPGVVGSDVDEDPDDRGLAQAFMDEIALQGRLVRFSSPDMLWEYDDRRGVWRRLSKGERLQFDDLLSEFLRARFRELGRGNLSHSRLSSVRKMLFGTLSQYYIDPSLFDSNAYLISFCNGVYDVERDALLPHDPDHMLTIARDYDYDPTAECPRYMRFLDEVLVRHEDPDDDHSPLVSDPELRALVQEMMGYCVATHCRAERGFFLHGNGRNGKSALIRVIQQVVGGHNVCDAFDVREIANPQMNLKLMGKLVALQAELDAGARIPDARYKLVVSGEALTAKEVYRVPVTFTPFATLIMAGNSLPETRDRSRGFWARTVVVPFLARFEGDAADTNLQDRFIPELAGIFNFALEGHRRLEAQGWKFSESASAREAAIRYREDSDAVLSWFNESLQVASGTVKLPTRGLFDHHCEYCRRFRYPADNLTKFSKRLKQIVDGREGRPFGTVADDGTPFSISFHRDSTCRGYAGEFRLVAVA